MWKLLLAAGNSGLSEIARLVEVLRQCPRESSGTESRGDNVLTDAQP